MSILYDIYPSPSNKETEGLGQLYHARTINRQTLDPEILVNHICERSTLGKGDVHAMLKELSHELTQQLLAGNRVYIPGIGYFSLSLQAPANTDPKSARAEHMRVKRIEYRAESQVRQKVVNNATFERSLEKTHSAKLGYDEIDNLVKEYLKSHPIITTAIFCEICHLTRSTARKHITRMVIEGLLVNTNTPKNPIYIWKDRLCEGCE